MRNGIIGFILGLLIAAGYATWRAIQEPEAVIGALAPDIQKQVATPEVRTVYVYRDAKATRGTPVDSAVLTAVKTQTGTATALLDAAGHASIVLQTDPLPWIARGSSHQATLIYGSMDGKAVNRLGYRWEFLRAKRLHLGFTAETNLGTSGENRTLIGLGLAYRW